MTIGCVERMSGSASPTSARALRDERERVADERDRRRGLREEAAVRREIAKSERDTE